MMSERPRSRIRRRAFAPISSTVEEAESSIQMGASPRLASDVVILLQSSRFMWPVRNLCASTRASDASRRSSSDSFDISRLKTATGSCCRIATFPAMFSASAVFPIDGRAARMINSDGCRPAVSLSRPGIAGGEAGDAAAFAEYLFEALEAILDQILDADQPRAHAVFGQLENRRFCAVENNVRIVSRGKRLLLNRGGGIDQAAQNRLFLHDSRVVLHIGDARQSVRKLRKISDAARRFEFPLRLRSSISVTVSIACRFSPSCTICSKMCRCCERKKSSGAERLYGGVQRVIIDQDRAENAALGFQILRQWPLDGDFVVAICIRFIFA